jgi:hypothetical protein
MVSGRPSTCDEQPSEPKQKKQRLSAIRSNSEQAMKLVEAYTPCANNVSKRLFLILFFYMYINKIENMVVESNGQLIPTSL